MTLPQPQNPAISEELEQRLAALSPTKRRLLEQRLQQIRGAASAASDSPQQSSIPRRSPDLPIPLSYTQQRFWFLHELAPEIPLFNNARAWRVRGSLDIGALEKALATTLDRHEILRTTYYQDSDGQLRQAVLQEWALAMPVVDLRDFSDREARVKQLLLDDACKRFDLTSEPSLRAAIYIMGEEEYFFSEIHHHIATDFWSAGIIRRELSALYQAFRDGRPSPLPDLPLQYADFAVWQRQQEQTGAFSRQMDYWRRKLAGPLTRLALPTGDGDPLPSHSGASTHTSLSPDLIHRMQELGRKENATLFMTLVAAFLSLFRRYSRQDDIIVGALIAGRNRVELEPLVGAFINAQIYRTDLSGDPSFRQIIGRVRQTALDALANQDVPFEGIVAEIQPDRSSEIDPIAGVMFDFLDAPSNPLKFPDSDWQAIEIDKGTAEYDMLIGARPSGASGYSEGLDLSIRFRTDIYHPSMIERMLEHLVILTEAGIAQPDTPSSELPLMSAAERRRLLIEWNDTAILVPLGLCFHQLFEQMAQDNPAAIAARDPGRSISYADLNAHANRLTHALLARGLQPGDNVALLADRSIDFLITMLGIWKAGGVYLPLDPRWPPLRLGQILNQSQARFLLVGDEYDSQETVPATEVERLSLASLLADPQPEHNPPARTSPSDLAYVIYTSGSTGAPKGAMVEHRGMLNHLFAKIHDLELTPADIVAQNSPQSFDISVWQFLAALLAGGQTHIFPDEVAFDPAALLRQVDAQGVTVFEAVPSLLRSILEVADDLAAAGQGISLARLRWLIPTGEAMPPSLSRALFARYPSLRQINAYGPTECSDDVTHFRMEAPPPHKANLAIGRPVANTQIYILDAHMQLTPIGVAGEIYVGGNGVGRGYLRDAARTAEVFLPNPFASQPGGRFYRTGDLGRWLDDGTIEFLGRVDFQVKVRGHRIELGEIENALLQHPAVTEAAVLALDDMREPDSRRLVGCLALREGHSFGASDAAQHLRLALPPYMIPAAFVFIAAPALLPKTTSGKIDRKALAALADSASAPRPKTFIAPRTPTESTIAAIWSDLLQQPDISVDDSFFDLGGHSLLAAQMVYRLRREFNADLPLRRLFETPTIAGLAGAVGRREEGGGSREYGVGRREEGGRNPEHGTGNAPSLLPLRPSGHRLPFFFLAGGGGSEDEYLTAYAGLIHRLGPDQPVYGFQASGIDDDLEPHTSVEAMAADFVAEMRTIQPRGPYYLGGECIGGKLALEMARILEQEGEEVGLLVLLNGVVIGLAQLVAAPAVSSSLSRRLRELRRLPPGQRLPRLALMVRNAATVLLPLNQAQRQQRDRRAAKLHYTQLLKNHRPSPYAGDIVLLMTCDLAERGRVAPWQELVQGEVRVQMLEGVHRTYLGEHVEANAAVLRASLEEAQSTSQA